MGEKRMNKRPVCRSSSKTQFIKTKLCPFLNRGFCGNGTNCYYAHSESELRPLPNLRQTKMCKKPSPCRDHDCPFAHSVQDLVPSAELMTFKTSLCLFWHEGKCFYGSKCRFAHGAAELRTRRKEIPRSPPQRRPLVDELKSQVNARETTVTGVEAFPPNPGINHPPPPSMSRGVYLMPMATLQHTPKAADVEEVWPAPSLKADAHAFSPGSQNCCEPRRCMIQNGEHRQDVTTNHLQYGHQNGVVRVAPVVSREEVPGCIGSGCSIQYGCCGSKTVPCQKDGSIIYGNRSCVRHTPIYSPCRVVSTTGTSCVDCEARTSCRCPAHYQKASSLSLPWTSQCHHKTPPKHLTTCCHGDVPLLGQTGCYPCLGIPQPNSAHHWNSRCENYRQDSLHPPHGCEDHINCDPARKRFEDPMEYKGSSQWLGPDSPNSFCKVEHTPSTTCSSESPGCMASDEFLQCDVQSDSPETAIAVPTPSCSRLNLIQMLLDLGIYDDTVANLTAGYPADTAPIGPSLHFQQAKAV